MGEWGDMYASVFGCIIGAVIFGFVAVAAIAFFIGKMM